ncbi:Lrp/AsnC family transcriptional regulator [Micrococcus terreus]|uniref:Lrp/AsnC family transcriptional regulator n=1 Tax=Micrococcus terreus TaxID=574650 RepID=UPI0021A91A94|nr:Lrp/AsnC family transcriptional regulator [Micrococcus terreus]MCT2088236.1 Lrp/AsnC family transcriptional regulator [Micrococcus terreus]MDK7702493.1 Lrp/AsnC family transcriptional regulator [Micrococcus terreus]WOO97833.1 Lrp/AsnC family transcriptional regulator [Micrococcus terreus]
MSTLDTTALRILAALAADPDATTVALATRLNLSRNTVQARLAALDRDGAVLSFERRISLHSLGHPLTAFVQVHVRQQHLGQIIQEIATIPEVVEAHGLTGSADVLARVAARDAEDLFRIHTRILDIEGVERADTSLAMAELVPWRTVPLVESLLEDGSAGGR